MKSFIFSTLVLLLSSSFIVQKSDIVGDWRLVKQQDSSGNEILFAENQDVVIIRWFLSGFQFRKNGVVFGLTTRKNRDFEINKGQKAKYKISKDGSTLILRDDVFEKFNENIVQELEMEIKDGSILVLTDSKNRVFTFEKA